jgi:hypothetical protein
MIELFIVVLIILVAAFAMYGVSEKEKKDSNSSNDEGDQEHFGQFPAPGAPPPVPFEVPPTYPDPGAYPGRVRELGAGDQPIPPYPGAVTFDPADQRAFYESGVGGYRDRTALETDNFPAGNPYDTARTFAPFAEGPCLDDDSYGGMMDADEAYAVQIRSRNDPTRVAAGIIRRKEFMDAYLREELEQEEDSRWWGRHEW